MEDVMTDKDESKMDLENTDGDMLASRWSRLGAAIIDGLTMIPITLPLMYFTGGFDDISKGIEPSVSYFLALSIAGMAVFLLIHGKFLVRDGQTLGKKVLNIKIVTLAGRHADVPTLAKRYGFSWLIPLIPVIGPIINMVNILFIFTKSKRCLHDHVGETKVINSN